MSIWKHADAVTFDVDSTVTTEEGIDELAKFCGKGEQIAELYVLYLISTIVQPSLSYSSIWKLKVTVISIKYMFQD